MRLGLFQPYVFMFLLSFAVTACKTTTPTPAPVSEIAVKPSQSATPSKTTVSKIPDKQDKDWRPDVYTVKKGDTLYSIGLEHGFDYKEIAQLNHIDPPYLIKIGQTLKLKELKTNTGKSKPIEKRNDDAVVTKPIQSDSLAPQGKALDEPIVGKALDDGAASPAATSNSAQSNTAAEVAAPSPAPSTPAKTDINEKLAQQTRPVPTASAPSAPGEWSWPAKGKVINPFAEGGNAKGIDIEGVLGQEVNAAGNGKVIYNGGDLRGYGNMVIIKHDKDFLSVYAHNSKSLVKEGQLISKGQKIAEMGSSGTDKVKLHFEIRFQGKSVDPIKYLGALPQ